MLFRHPVSCLHRAAYPSFFSPAAYRSFCNASALLNTNRAMPANWRIFRTCSPLGISSNLKAWRRCIVTRCYIYIQQYRAPAAPALSFPALNGGACRASGQGVLLVDLDRDARLRQESRILSRWEIDYLHPEGINA